MEAREMRTGLVCWSLESSFAVVSLELEIPDVHLKWRLTGPC